MSQSTIASERLTAIASTLVAVAILAAGVTAQQSQSPKSELELLKLGLQFQLDRAFQHDVEERTERLARLGETIEAWRASPRSEEDRKLLASWLLESTIRSMPGTTEPLPSIPEFGKPVSIASVEPVESEILHLSEVFDPLEQATGGHDKNADSASPEASAYGSDRKTIPVLRQSLNRLLPVSPKKISTPLPVQRSLSNEKPVQVNLVELAARIAGYHDGLDQIETTLLLASSHEIDFLEKQVQKLEDLSRDFRFVSLYHGALSEKERKTVRPPRSMQATLAELGKLLQRNESRQDGDFLGAFDPVHRERIEKLRERLADIADCTK